MKVPEESRVAWQRDVLLLNSAVCGSQQMFLLQRQGEKKIHTHKFLLPNPASFVSHLPLPPNHKQGSITIAAKASKERRPEIRADLAPEQI